MVMKIVAICGGGGKTTLAEKYPDIFLDIDKFVWSDKNIVFHSKIIEYLENENYGLLGKTYKQIFISNKDYLKSLDKTILVHHPTNASWLDCSCTAMFKPEYKLFLKNIKNRNKNLQKASINSWNELTDAYIFKTHEELERRVFDKINPKDKN